MRINGLYACYYISVQPGRPLRVGDRALLRFVFFVERFLEKPSSRSHRDLFLSCSRMPRCQVHSSPPNLGGPTLLSELLGVNGSAFVVYWALHRCPNLVVVPRNHVYNNSICPCLLRRMFIALLEAYWTRRTEH